MTDRDDTTTEGAALAMGAVRIAAGILFIVDPRRMHGFLFSSPEAAPSARLLVRSMGYRDLLIGALLTAAALRGRDTRALHVASAGADAVDLFGGLDARHEMAPWQQLTGLGGAVAAIGAGLWGATRRRPSTNR